MIIRDFRNALKLLIAPEGIEISFIGKRFDFFGRLLIAPEGIEIYKTPCKRRYA